MIDLLTGSHRASPNIANRPEVTLVHDDGRAFLTRSDRTFDVIQMSLVDTWAATGAGAFTLSENGLYTLEAWRRFLNRLTPGGVLSVSRWFDPRNVSETSRLLALGVAALIDRGVANPHDHLLLVVRGRVATLMVSNAPFGPPRTASSISALSPNASSRSSPCAVAAERARARRPDRRQHDDATSSDARDLPIRASTTRRRPIVRPYYFNMLKPRALLARAATCREAARSAATSARR